ncbi:helix-turn-helix domain-containing protein [Pseudoalteromonas sp. MTN2-4]|uniref:helix-turn-helix domain-containing protein n=1 Tax=Pseudoalteromonas sp. MTN2-4 TaxID=3056555 RepID=UPI0036F2ADA7
MLLKQLRAQKGWSQETLAEESKISVRTIQRIENGKRANLETLKGIANALDVEVNTLTRENKLSAALNKEQKSFISNLIYFAVVMLSLMVISVTSAESENWVWWIFLGGSLYLLFDGLEVFGVFKALEDEEENT